MKTRLFYILAVLIVAGALAQAQQPAPEARTAQIGQGQGSGTGSGPGSGPRVWTVQEGHGGQDPFARNFYPPELIMQKQEALQLTDEQLAYFKTELRKAQLNFTELQWKLQDESEKLLTLAKAQRPNEEAILGQLEKVLTAERDVKRAQLTLLVRIKNKLTPVQQEILNHTRQPDATPRPEGE